MEYQTMTWGEFLRRGLTEDADIAYSDREARQIKYRLSDRYNRTYIECIKLDLKVMLRVLKRRFNRMDKVN